MKIQEIKNKVGEFFPLILAAIVIVSVFMFKACESKAPDVIGDANALYDFKDSYLGKGVKGYEYLGVYVVRTLSDGTKINVLSKGFENQLLEFIESDKLVDKTTWFNLRRILFETGSSKIDNRSQAQIDNVGKILKSYPNVELKLGGYTDNIGSVETNMSISGLRAKALLDELVAIGVAPERLTSEGYGQEHSIADNTTVEGRALNRRVAARVTKK